MKETIIAVIILVAIVGLAGFYVYRAKKQGQKCIGCPHAKSCPSAKESSPCSCGCGDSK